MNHGRVLQLPCDFLSTKWTVLALHFPSLLEECSNNVQSMNTFIGSHDGTAVPPPIANPAIKYVYSQVQRIQFCSNLYVKNVITSGHKYTISTFPKEVRFFVGKSYSFDDFYEYFWIITPPTKQQREEAATRRDDDAIERAAAIESMDEEALAAQGHVEEHVLPRSQPAAQSLSGRPIYASTAQSATARREVDTPMKASVPVNVLPFVGNASQSHANSSGLIGSAPLVASHSASTAAASVASSGVAPLSARAQSDLSRLQPLTAAEFDEDPLVHARDDLPTNVATNPDSARSILKERIHTARTTEPDVNMKGDSTLHPDPIITLDKIIGYSSSRTSRNLTWSPDGQYMIYPSNNMIICANVKTGEQDFLTGHTANVNLVSMSSNGILATGQEGKQAVIRLWNFRTRQCVGILMAHNSDLRCLAFSYMNLMLAAVGRDAQGRVLIVIWDISALLDTGKIHIVAKQLSDFGINKLQFSPFREDPMHLISCGHESIRFWRIKTKHLPGSSLALNEHARNTFTDLAFESKYGEADQTTKRMFVATASGALFQINYATRTLECIYKLHSGPIYSISINEGFCVTGSGDSFLRVWPLDFSDFYLQAQHKGAITSVQISQDGLHVLVGSENGCIGVMDLGSTAYQTRIRSHLDTIYAVAFDPHRDEFATVSKDGTIRIFGIHSLEQIYEFMSPNETILCVAYHPSAAEYRIACGFASGSVRIMDIATTTMHVDYQQHTGRVLDVVFSNDGQFLYSNGEDGNICAYDVTKNYLPVRMFTTYRHQPLPLPPSVSRTVGADHERAMASGKLSARREEEHEGRSPFLSHHLDRARQEEKERENPTIRPHSHSHQRHCAPAGWVPGVGANSASVVPHSHGPPSAHAAQPILPAHALAISDDGSLLATIGADPTSIVLLSTDTLRQVRLFTTNTSGSHAANTVGVARILFVQHSKELCVILTDQSWQRFSVESGNLLAHIQATPSLRFKQERSSGALSSRGGGGELHGLAFAAAASGQPNLPYLGATCTAASISPLNLFLLTGSNESLLRVWDFHSKPHAPHFQSFSAHSNMMQPQEGVTGIQFSPDGKKLITTGGDAIWIWTVRANEREALDQLKRRVQKRQLDESRAPIVSLPHFTPHSSQTLAVGYRPDSPTAQSATAQHDHDPALEDELQHLQLQQRPYQPHAFQEDEPNGAGEQQPLQAQPNPTREAWGTNVNTAANTDLHAQHL